MKKKIISLIMIAIMLFSVTSNTALASNSGLEVQGGISSIYGTTDEVESGNYTIEEDASIVEETENEITVDNKDNGLTDTQTTDAQTTDAQTTDTQATDTQTTDTQTTDTQTTGTQATDAQANTDTTIGPESNQATTTIDSTQESNTNTSVVPATDEILGPKAVESLKYKSTNFNEITLTWKASEGASKYKIYRATSEDGTYKRIKTTKSTTYKQRKLSCGNIYYYKVIPYEGSLAGEASIIKVKTKPNKITNLTTSVKDDTIKLTWKKGKGSTSYYVYRSTNKKSGFKKIGETTKLKYSDKNLARGESYYYRIYPVNNNIKGAKVTTSTACRVLFGPKAVTSLKFKRINYKTIKLTWRESRGATKYVIYRATSKDGKYKKVKTTTSSSFQQSGLSCGKTYYYKIIPYKDSVSGTARIRKVNTKPDKVKKLKATVQDTTIKLTWKRGIANKSYYIYRSTSKSSGYAKIAEITKTKYYDTELESDQTYYYKIYSVSRGTKGKKVTCSATIASTDATNSTDSTGEMRAAWISYLDYGTLKDKSESEFTKNIDAMYDTVLSNNLNTVIVHVRAFGDAIYPSNYYSWANFVTSNSDGPGYDPLAIMIAEAHKKGLSFQAWINPYRTADGGRVNPASSSAVKKIINGVDEIVSNYDVDGIHFDDYFYLSTDNTSQDVKMQNVNHMIQSVYAKIKSINSNVVFGISPAGNVEYAKSIGCDVDAWLSSTGYVDYVCPQLYWSDDYVTKSGVSTKMFTNTMKQWASLNQNNTALYAGLALYKVGAPLETAWGSDYGWGNSNSNLYDQYKAAKSDGYSGFSLYRYGSMGLSAAKAELVNLKKLSQ
ncbi:MAG: family 10 glycosylhydrolase [Lachnotalea sp.]